MQDQKNFLISSIIRMCHFCVEEAVPELKAWLKMLPYHFYAENLTEWMQSQEFLNKQKPLVCWTHLLGPELLG